MSSDYRPRGGSGGRRRRGGRGRSQGPRSHSNGTSSYSGSSPKKPTGFWSKIKSWFSSEKKTDTTRSSRPYPARTDASPRGPRPERSDRPRREDRPDRPDRGPRPEPKMLEILSPKLYVGNLAYEASESDLFDLFSKVGAVKNVEIAMDLHANRSKGFGFVEMEELETAKEASAKLNRTDFMGRQIVVSGAKVDRRSPQSSSSPESESGSESNF
jgi:RNA recognition motif-containing protein